MPLASQSPPWRDLKAQKNFEGEKDDTKTLLWSQKYELGEPGSKHLSIRLFTPNCVLIWPYSRSHRSNFRHVHTDGQYDGRWPYSHPSQERQGVDHRRARWICQRRTLQPFHRNLHRDWLHAHGRGWGTHLAQRRQSLDSWG